MNNSQILYLYDAKMCNPNGDPDEENRPRMDYEREINLVSDLRLKRYIRDYLLLQGKELYVQKVDGEPVTSANRVKEFVAKDGKLDFGTILEAYEDIRLFGATVTAKKDNRSFTGPVQFNWGYSLNRVEVLESSITSHFASSESNKQGAIGKDYRVKYALIAFSGTLSGHRSSYTKTQESDIRDLDDAMVNAIPLLSTRSKIGQYPRLYLRFELVDEQSVLRDLRSYIKLSDDSPTLRDITECELDVSALSRYLEEQRSKIKCVYYYNDETLKMVRDGEAITMDALLAGLETERLS